MSRAKFIQKVYFCAKYIWLKQALRQNYDRIAAESPVHFSHGDLTSLCLVCYN